jgi:hypothetical protein
MTVYEELKARGLIAQVTDEEESKLIDGAGHLLYRFRPDGGQPPCRSFHGALSYEAPAGGGKRPIAPKRRRHRLIGDPAKKGLSAI